MSIFYRILSIIIIICIPVICVLSALNIVYRMPDLYSYDFNKYQTARQLDLNMKDDDLGQFFSDFMTGKQDSFRLTVEYQDKKQSVFSSAEQVNMENARKLLNGTLFALGGAVILAVTGCWIYLENKRKYELRIAFKGGIIALAVTMAVLYGALCFRQFRAFLYGHIFIQAFGADDVLPKMLTAQFARISLAGVFVVSLILLVIFVSAIWRLTKPRRMFG